MVIEPREGLLHDMEQSRPEPVSDVSGVDVIIVANFTGDDASSNNRFNDLAQRLATRGATVELLTSDFSHTRKVRRRWAFGEVNYKITRISESGYRRNISLARLRSQASFARALERYLEERPTTPNVIVAAVPPPAVGGVCARFGESRDVPVVVDIQDLWPEAFGMVGRMRWPVQAVFWQMRHATRRAYKGATLIVGVSQTYIEVAQRTSDSSTETLVVYLGTDLEKFDSFARGTRRAPDHFKVAYVGSLSRSYDLPTVIDALRLLAHRRPDLGEVQLVVMGDGASRKALEARAQDAGVNVDFLGKLPYPDMVRKLVSCDIAVNPIVRGSAGSILNKVCDYAAAGLPVINTQESPEYRSLIERFSAGINCAPESAEEVAMALERLISDTEMRKSMGNGNRKLADRAFNRAVTYEGLVDRIIAASHN